MSEFVKVQSATINGTTVTPGDYVWVNLGLVVQMAVVDDVAPNVTSFVYLSGGGGIQYAIESPEDIILRDSD